MGDASEDEAERFLNKCLLSETDYCQIQFYTALQNSVEDNNSIIPESNVFPELANSSRDLTWAT